MKILHPIGAAIERIMKSPRGSSPPPSAAKAVEAVASFLGELPSKPNVSPSQFNLIPPPIHRKH